MFYYHYYCHYYHYYNYRSPRHRRPSRRRRWPRELAGGVRRPHAVLRAAAGVLGFSIGITMRHHDAASRCGITIGLAVLEEMATLPDDRLALIEASRSWRWRSRARARLPRNVRGRSNRCPRRRHSRSCRLTPGVGCQRCASSRVARAAAGASPTGAAAGQVGEDVAALRESPASTRFRPFGYDRA